MNQVMITLGLMLTAPLLQAQVLSLFEPTETETLAQSGPAPQAPAAFAGTSQPAFTLRSTSRIGDTYHVTLVSRDGSVAQLSWHTGERALVPGFDGFAVTSVQGRTVVLSQPEGETCTSAPDRGVNCSAGDIAMLTLANSAPLVASAQQGVTQVRGPNDPFAAAAAAAANGAIPQAVLRDGGQQVVINPFTGQPEVVAQGADRQFSRAQRQQARAERLQQFVPPRIDDSQVPEGMRKVSTPFGDRLVPIRE